MKRIISLAVVFLASLTNGFAADLFVDGKLREIKPGDAIVATDTIGGYPIFQDDGRWKFVSSKESSATSGSKMGSVLLDYTQGTYLLARQSLYASLGAGGSNSSWSGSPCSPDHLVVRNKGRGLQDNCMTIDPRTITLGTVPTVFLAVALTNTGGNGRYYQLVLYINADLLGARGTVLADWTKQQLETKPFRQKALDRLLAWAEPLQDGSILALDFSKPQDVYSKIPSLMTLLPVPEDLAGLKRSVSFLSAIEHLRHEPEFASIAYSHTGDYRGYWSFVTGQASQEVADTEALAKCEVNRKTSKTETPACTVYRIKPKAGA